MACVLVEGTTLLSRTAAACAKLTNQPDDARGLGSSGLILG